jgi:L-malate glycosyltransferase
MTNILHITPHFGGGVGTVLTKLITALNNISNFHNDVVTLEYANERAKEWSEDYGIRIYESIDPDSNWLHKKMQDADIVHIHFWNHPALYFLMNSFSGKIARIVIWAHVNGHYAPYLFNNAILNFPEMFVVSTDYSLIQQTIAFRSEKWKESHLRSIHSTAGLNGFDKIGKKEHRGVNVGYIGTVDYVKMHSAFIDICKSVRNSNVKFIVCGGNKHEEILAEAKVKGVAERFNFLGKVSDVKEVFSEIDIFAYPLNRKNYGTGEQVLIEAMSAGIPQIVFGNGNEEYVVKDGETGIICYSSEKFTEAIENLSNDKIKREEMSIDSRKYAKAKYNIRKSIGKWLTVYDTLLSREKNVCSFQVPKGKDLDIGTVLFLLALGECQVKDLFLEILKCYPNDIPPNLQERITNLPTIFKGRTRGSARHYNHVFESTQLEYISKQLKKGRAAYVC